MIKSETQNSLGHEGSGRVFTWFRSKQSEGACKQALQGVYACIRLSLAFEQRYRTQRNNETVRVRLQAH